MLEKELAILAKDIQPLKTWSSMFGRLADIKTSREAVALGREIPSTLTKSE